MAEKEAAAIIIDDEFDWSNLPEELKVEILCRLGEKPLMRLKCVSRSWYFLISNRCNNHPSSPFCGLFYTRRDSYTLETRLVFRRVRGEYKGRLFRKFPIFTMARFMESLLPFKYNPLDFVDCCNGLLLFVRYPEYYVVNPTTYECIRIPDNPQTFDIAASALAFDPPNTSFLVVTKAKCPVRNSSLDLDVFSSHSGNWASHTIPLDPILNGFRFIDRSVYLNGNLYMLSAAKCLLTIHLKQKAATDICARATELPAKHEFRYCGTFGVLAGTLAYSNSDCNQILVWVLLQDGVRWALRHTISLHILVSHPQAYEVLHMHRKRGWIRVYAFHPNSEQIFVGTPDGMQTYHFKTKELGGFELLSNQVVYRGSDKVFPYSRCPIILKCAIKNNE